MKKKYIIVAASLLMLIGVCGAIGIGITTNDPNILIVHDNAKDPAPKSLSDMLPHDASYVFIPNPDQFAYWNPMNPNVLKIYTGKFVKPGVTVQMLSVWNGLTSLIGDNYWYTGTLYYDTIGEAPPFYQQAVNADHAPKSINVG